LFFVKKTKRLINYELDLSRDVKVFLVFYILYFIIKTSRFQYIYIEIFLLQSLEKKQI